jgi:Reverse transcriptase (RNA-dependent DNA polymerase)
MRRDIKTQYTAYHSTTNTGNGGLLMLVHKKYAKVGAAAQQAVPTECKGYILHVTVGMPYTATLHLVGVYIPCDAAHVHMRPVVYKHLSTLLQSLPEEDTAVLAGDWNAALCDGDRAHQLTSTDNRHADWVQTQLRLQSVYTAMKCRQPTFSVVGMGDSPSMIDDILLRTPAGVNTKNAIHSAGIQQEHGYNTDHALLTTSLSGGELNIIHATDNPVRARAPPMKRLKSPISNATRQAFQQRLLEAASGLMQKVDNQLMPASLEADVFLAAQKLRDAKEVHKLTTLHGRPAEEVVNEIADSMMELLTKALEVALDTCDTVMTNPGGIHHKPKKVSKHRRKQMASLKHARQLCGKLKRTVGTSEEQYARDDVAALLAQVPVPAPPSPAPAGPAAAPAGDAAGASSTPTDAATDPDVDALRHIADAATCSIRAIDIEHRKESVQMAQDKLYNTLKDKPKQGHKMLFGAGMQQHTLEAVHDPDTGRVTTDPRRVEQVVESLFRKQQQPPTGVKHGLYLPDDAPRGAEPWRGELDTMQLCTDATLLPTRTFLSEYIMDQSTFHSCCRTLGSGKAPGPDGITNDVIKILPVQVKTMLHKLFIVMWATGHTPDAWKNSDTCMIYKKGTPTNPLNYRPIGLANTVYKLWTRMVTYVMYEYAEQHRIISGAQAGFRKNNSTHKQIQTLVLAYEDAKITGQDMYTMQVDFSSAFNMTDHDLTLQILYDLGFPTDAIEVVKDIYTNATTTYKTAYGKTGPVPVDRGTLQGDTLSPFLFLMYIEPLLRWLHVGARGYQFGSVAPEQQLSTMCSNLAYADDLSILTMTTSNMHMQADKLSRYADWAHMKVNTDKTVVTGILHSNVHTGLVGHRRAVDHVMIAARLRGKIYVQGTPVKFIQPDAPFKYLGVLLTLTLDWKHQFNAMMAAVKRKCRALSNRGLPAGMQTKVIRTVIKPMITYSFGAAPYTPAQLQLFDAQLARAAKVAYKQKVSMSTALALEDADKFGLGLTSLLVDYTHTCIRNLIGAVNDPTSYGCISKSLLAFQAARTGSLQEAQLHGVANTFMRVRQLSAAHQSGLQIVNQSTLEELSLEGTDIVRLVTSLGKGATEMGLPAHIPCRLVQPLTALGMHKVEDILTKNRRMVISAQDMRLRYGKKATAAHIQALYRIAYILHKDEPLNMRQVKKMHFTDVEVHSKQLRTVHAVHMAALAMASQHTTEQSFRNIIKPMPRTNLSNEITQYMSCPQPAAEPDAEPAAAQLAKRARPGTRTGTGARKSEQRPAMLQLNINVQKGRKRKRPNEHRKEIVAAPQKARKARTQATRREPPILTRQERASRMYDQHAELPDQKGAIRALEKCTDTAHTVQRIIGWRMVTNHKGNILKEKKVEGASQVQYLVDWAPTLEEAWAVQAYKDLGYKPTSAVPISFASLSSEPANQDLYDQIACEVCCSKHSDHDMVLCDDCDRGYHRECLAHQQPQMTEA